MALVYQKTRAEAVCSLEQNVFALLNDKSHMKGDFHLFDYLASINSMPAVLFQDFYLQ